MAFEHARVIEVRHGGRTVGALAPGAGVTEFQYDPLWLRTGIELAEKLQKIHKSSYQSERLERLFAHGKVSEAVRAGRPYRDVAALMDAETKAFREKRERYLLYPKDACPPRGG